MKKAFSFILFVLIAFSGIAQNLADSTSVFNQIKESKKEQDQKECIRFALNAVENSSDFGLYTQVEAKRNLAAMYWRFNDKYNALRTFLELNNELEKKEKWDFLASNYSYLAKLYKRDNLYASAIENFNQAASIANEHVVQFDHWQLNIEIGDLYLASFNPADALKEFKTAKGILESAEEPDDERTIITLHKLALAYNALGRHWDAIQVNIVALDLMEKYGKGEDYAAQLNNIGYAFQKLGVSSSALKYFQQTLEERENQGFTDKDQVSLLINIGIAYQNMHESKNSRDYLQRALSASTNLEQQAQINDLIALAYIAEENLVLAREYNEKSLFLAKQSGSKDAEAESYYTASIIDEKSLNYAEALDSFKKYRDIKDSISTAQQLNKQAVLQTEMAVKRTQAEIQTLISSNEIKDYEIQQLRLEAENSEKAMQIKEAEARAKLQALQLERARLEAERNERENAILKAREENQQLLIEQQRLEEEKAKKDLEIAEEKNRVQELQLERRKTASRGLFFILLLVLVLAIVMIIAWRQTRKKNKQLAESRDLIRQERDRSDELLLNILPESTANELKSQGRAAPRKYDSATIFFSDFVSFSQLSKKYSPEELIEELELFFGGFDKIIAKYNIEKIKTIGDAYMCASGIPKETDDHALRMVKAAIEMLSFADEMNELQIKKGREPWKLRVGINTGPVVAGVIGSNKFIYDVWGDAVNLASRLETASEPGRINISQETLNRVKPEVRCSFRGEIEVKNMGSVRMFFVENLR